MAVILEACMLESKLVVSASAVCSDSIQLISFVLSSCYSGHVTSSLYREPFNKTG